MKARLIFDLNEPEDKMSFKRTTKAEDMAIVLWEINNNIKKEIERKIENGSIPEGQGYRYDGLDLFYEKFHELMEEWDININNLID